MLLAGGPIASADPLDFRDGLWDSRKGPWEVMTPRTSLPWRGIHFPSGHCNLRLTESCHIFGDMDDLAWDLGNPDAAVTKSPIPINMA